MSGSDTVVEMLKDIREEIHGLRTDLREEIHGFRTELREQIQSVRTELGAELRIHTERFGVIETALSDLAGQQRFVLRSLESRIDRYESK